jgi:hypothetical protein
MKQPVPSRSWNMTDETKKWVICGHSPENQASLLTQITEAEQPRFLYGLFHVIFGRSA